MKKKLLCFILIFMVVLPIFAKKKTIKDASNLMSKAANMVVMRKYEESLKIYLYCYDNYNDFEESFKKIRRSFLLIYIKRLADKYEPAKEAMLVRLNKILKKIEGNQSIEPDLYLIANTLIKDYKKEDDFYNLYKSLNLEKLKDKRNFFYNFFNFFYEKKEYKAIYQNLNIKNEIVVADKRLSTKENKERQYYYYHVDFFVKKLVKYKRVFKENGDKKGVKLAEKLRQKYVKIIE